MQNQRLKILIYCVIVMFLFGIYYTWSNFLIPIETETGWNRSQTSVAYTLTAITFSVGNIAGSKLCKKCGCRNTLYIVCALVFASFLTVFLSKTLLALYMGYGVGWGVALGIGYNTLISCASLWYPEKNGMVTGVLLTVYGIGGLILGMAASAIIPSIGWRYVFLALGCMLGVATCIAALLVRAPEAGEVMPQKQGSAHQNGAYADMITREMVKTSSFWRCYGWGAVLILGGMIFFSNAMPIAISFGATVPTAALFSGVLAFMNGAGRLISGAIFDRFQYKKTLYFISGMFSISVAVLFIAFKLHSQVLLLICYIFLGLAYGGIYACNIVIVRDFFGPKHHSMNMSVILTTSAPASICGPTIAAAIQTATGSYEGVMPVLAVTSVMGLLFSYLIKPPANNGKKQSRSECAAQQNDPV